MLQIQVASTAKLLLLLEKFLQAKREQQQARYSTSMYYSPTFGPSRVGVFLDAVSWRLLPWRNLPHLLWPCVQPVVQDETGIIEVGSLGAALKGV